MDSPPTPPHWCRNWSHQKYHPVVPDGAAYKAGSIGTFANGEWCGAGSYYRSHGRDIVANIEVQQAGIVTQHLKAPELSVKVLPSAGVRASPLLPRVILDITIATDLAGEGGIQNCS